MRNYELHDIQEQVILQNRDNLFLTIELKYPWEFL